MDIEKTIQFLIQNRPAHDERLTRIENVLGALVDNVSHLDNVMATLANSHIKLVERMDTLAQQSREEDRRLGERIDKLVSGLGEFIRNRPTTG